MTESLAVRSSIIKLLVVALAMPGNTSTLHAQSNSIHKLTESKPNVAAASLSSYLDRVRAENSNIQAAPGSIWTESGRLTRMTTDVRGGQQSLAGPKLSRRDYPRPARHSPISTCKMPTRGQARSCRSSLVWARRPRLPWAGLVQREGWPI